MSSANFTESLDTQRKFELLRRVDPILTPDRLRWYFPAYEGFTPMRNSFGLWCTLEKYSEILKQKLQHKKVILAISGISAGGKDALREEMERQAPELFMKMVTGTSREPREGETHGQAYYFYKDLKVFEEAEKNGEFIETSEQGDRRYGFPKASLQAALLQEKPILCTHIEMNGWLNLDEYLQEQLKLGLLKELPMVVKIFVIPQMNFNDYLQWLNDKRGITETKSRLQRTLWELQVAPHRADFICTNRFGRSPKALQWTARSIIEQITPLFSEPLTVPEFDGPVPPKLGNNIVGYRVRQIHDGLVE